jgi:hypothetical protein
MSFRPEENKQKGFYPAGVGTAIACNRPRTAAMTGNPGPNAPRPESFLVTFFQKSNLFFLTSFKTI